MAMTKTSTEMTALSMTESDSLGGDDKDLYRDDSFVYNKDKDLYGVSSSVTVSDTV